MGRSIDELASRYESGRLRQPGGVPVGRDFPSGRVAGPCTAIEPLIGGWIEKKGLFQERSVSSALWNIAPDARMASRVLAVRPARPPGAVSIERNRERHSPTSPGRCIPPVFACQHTFTIFEEDSTFMPFSKTRQLESTISMTSVPMIPLKESIDGKP